MQTRRIPGTVENQHSYNSYAFLNVSPEATNHAVYINNMTERLKYPHCAM